MPTIKIDPAVLMGQSAEMLGLTENYDRLFQSVTSSLTTMNTRWSANLSNNFATKITSARSAFSSLTSLLNVGAQAAKQSATDFLTIDNALVGAGIGAASGASSAAGASGAGAMSNEERLLSIAFGPLATKLGITHGVKKLIDKGRKNYKDHGWVYDAVEYGKCALKIGGGLVKAVGGAVQLAGGSPLGALVALSAINDFNNAAADITYISLDDYNAVGTTNWLKDLLHSKGGELGDYMGNRELGEQFGDLTYSAYNAVSFLSSMDSLLKAFGKLNTSATGEAKDSFVWGKTTFDDMMESPKWYEIKDKIINHFASTDSPVYYTVQIIDKIKSVVGKGRSTLQSVIDAVT